MSSKARSQTGGRAIDFLEEAVHLLRLAPAADLVVYYIGSAPFIVGFLYFWTDMSRSAFAQERHGRASLAIALLFLWMKTWQAAFAGLLHDQVNGQRSQSWTWSQAYRAFCIQAMVQPSALLVLPLAFAVTMPFGWAFAFYQNVTIFGGRSGGSLIEVCQRASKQAQLWPGQNHALLAVLGLFGLFVFLNVGIVLFQIPQLLATLLGIETVFSQSGWSMLNTTFLTTTLGITYLCVDPIIKAVYVLRCFHGEAVQTGADLKLVLRSFPTASSVVCAAFLVTALLPCLIHAAEPSPEPVDPPRATAAPGASQASPAGQPSAGRTVPASELDRAIRDVISQREYSWRLPRVKAQRPQDSGLIFGFIRAAVDTLQSWLKASLAAARDLIQRIVEFIFKRLGPHRELTPSGMGSNRGLQILLYGLLAAVVGALGLLLWRIGKRGRPRGEQIMAQPMASLPDLTDENLAADQRPEESWLALAEELADKGQLRLALRAFYLAGLAHLGRRGLVRIARFKSNREYAQELRRRVPAQTVLQAAFGELVWTFDWAWYGLGEVDQAVVGQFREHLNRVTAS